MTDSTGARSISAEPCSLRLKGYAEPVKAYVTRVA